MPVYLMKNERQQDVLPPAGRKGTFVDGTAVESAFGRYF